jgi:hypothetical protein
MKKNLILPGVIGVALLSGTLDCHAEKWDRMSFKGDWIESGYYDTDSIKVQGKTVSWTEKCVYDKDGSKNISSSLSKYPACKQKIEKSEVAELQVDCQIENKKYRVIGKMYYNKAGEILCTDRDFSKDDFNQSWTTILRHSSMENTYYDLLTKYKVNLK